PHLAGDDDGDDLVDSAGRLDFEGKTICRTRDLHGLPGPDLMPGLPDVPPTAILVGEKLEGGPLLIAIVDQQIAADGARDANGDGLPDPNLVARQHIDRHLGETTGPWHGRLPRNLLQDRLNATSPRRRGGVE